MVRGGTPPQVGKRPYFSTFIFLNTSLMKKKLGGRYEAPPMRVIEERVGGEERVGEEKVREERERRVGGNPTPSGKSRPIW